VSGTGTMAEAVIALGPIPKTMRAGVYREKGIVRVEEVPVRMEPRASGVSKLRGRKAVKVTATVIGTLVVARFLRGRASD